MGEAKQEHCDACRKEDLVFFHLRNSVQNKPTQTYIHTHARVCLLLKPISSFGSDRDIPQQSVTHTDWAPPLFKHYWASMRTYRQTNQLAKIKIAQDISTHTQNIQRQTAFFSLSHTIEDIWINSCGQPSGVKHLHKNTRYESCEGHNRTCI